MVPVGSLAGRFCRPRTLKRLSPWVHSSRDPFNSCPEYCTIRQEKKKEQPNAPVVTQFRLEVEDAPQLLSHILVRAWVGPGSAARVVDSDGLSGLRSCPLLLSTRDCPVACSRRAGLSTNRQARGSDSRWEEPVGWHPQEGPRRDLEKDGEAATDEVP